MHNLTGSFAALGDATRFAIVERLLTEGELSAGALRSGTGISPPAVSRHLKVLHDAGLVQRRTQAQSRLYSVRPEAMKAIDRWIIEHREFWMASLDRLEKALTKETGKT